MIAFLIFLVLSLAGLECIVFISLHSFFVTSHLNAVCLEFLVVNMSSLHPISKEKVFGWVSQLPTCVKTEQRRKVVFVLGMFGDQKVVMINRRFGSVTAAEVVIKLVPGIFNCALTIGAEAGTFALGVFT